MAAVFSLCILLILLFKDMHSKVRKRYVEYILIYNADQFISVVSCCVRLEYKGKCVNFTMLKHKNQKENSFSSSFSNHKIATPILDEIPFPTFHY